MILVALDPGKTTGFARLNTNLIDRISVEEFHSLDALEKALSVCLPIDRLIYEAFSQRFKPSELISRDIIGAVGSFAYKTGTIIVPQSSSVGKTYWTNDKLKAVGAYTKGKPHGRDATRHLLYYLTFCLKNPYYNLKLNGKL